MNLQGDTLLAILLFTLTATLVWRNAALIAARSFQGRFAFVQSTHSGE